MVKLAVAGSNEFVVGFRLAGIKNVIEMGSNPEAEIKDIMKNKEIGIVVIEEGLVNRMDSHNRNIIEGSVQPVFMPLSSNIEQESLKRLIKKSIGVDLWK